MAKQMTPQAKMVVEGFDRKYPGARKMFNDDMIRTIIAAEMFYIMNAQDDSIAWARIKEVTQTVQREVEEHFGV